MAEPITIDELMAELQRLGMPENRGNDDGWTVKELMDLWGLGRETVREQIRKGLAAGIVTNGKAYRECIDGMMRRSPVYRFKVAVPVKKPTKKKPTAAS